MLIEFRDENCCYIKQWPNWTGVIPAVGDTVLLHYGDDNEQEECYRVEEREISGTKPDKVTLYIRKTYHRSGL